MLTAALSPVELPPRLNTLVGVKGKTGLFESQAVSWLVPLISPIKTHPFSRLAMFRNPVSVIIPSFEQCLYWLLMTDCPTKEELRNLY